MLVYDSLIVGGLVIASFLSLPSIKSIYLCFVTALFLVVIPSAIPESISRSEAWFPVAIYLEATFAFCAFLTRAHASRFIASVCWYNILAHVAAWYCWKTENTLYNGYDFWLIAGESIQVIALIVSSKPVTAFILEKHLECLNKESRREYRLAANSS